MIKYKKDNISSLSELFQVWMGGVPENDYEIRDFLKNSKLEKIIGVSDVDAILRDIAYFPEVVLPAIHSAIPLKLKLYNQEKIVSSQELYKLNYWAEKSETSFCLSISFGAALEMQMPNLAIKKQQISALEEQRKQSLRLDKMLLQHKKKETKAEIAALEREIKREEKEALAKKKAEEREYNKVMLKIRAKAQKIANRKKQELELKKAEELEQEKKVLRPKRLRNLRSSHKYWEGKQSQLEKMQEEFKNLEALGAAISAEQKLSKNKLFLEIDALSKKVEKSKNDLKRAFSTERNKVYREKHRVEIRERVNLRRLTLKEQDADIIKLKDKEDNAKADRKRYCRTYYERHKEEISLKTNGNPKAAIYKKQYKIKKRFETKTGPVIMALLNGILNSKGKN